MAKLVIQPTSTAQWHALVSEAESAASCVLNEDLESYLVFLLMRFASNPHMLARVIGKGRTSPMSGSSGLPVLA